MMMLPLQITFRDVARSEAVDAHVRRRAAKLDTFFDRITSCRVVVENPHRRHHQGRDFRVRIDLTVPGAELVTARDPAKNLNHQDMHAAVDDAFDDAERVLEDYRKRMLSSRRGR
jgi:ribosomal subunit interface protein